MKIFYIIPAFLLMYNLAFSQNYDESKVPAYILPDVFTEPGGVAVKTTRDWERYRRPEILKLFEDNIYGTMPERFDSIRFKLLKEKKGAMGGKATLKEVVISVYNKHRSIGINLVLFTPEGLKKPAPAFLLINNRGRNNTDPERIIRTEFWPAELLIDSGYAVAAFHVSDLAPDNKNTFASAALELFPDELSRNSGMRAIGAWAFGASRIMDYFETDPDIDVSKVAVAGHSRGGKAALWAAAHDKRFAICFSNCSGNTGAALARRQFGERITDINRTFPHWFNDNYKKYNDRENLLPVDQHMLIALIAPRPVYVTNASEDLWADPRGTYLALKNAEPVYALYGNKQILPDNAPPLNTSVTSGVMGYHNREGKHDMTVFDWQQFIEFASMYYRR